MVDLFEKAKKSRAFGLTDALVCLVAAAFVGTLFLACFLFVGRERSTGIEISIDGKLAAIYTFGGDLVIYDGYEDIIGGKKTDGGMDIEVVSRYGRNLVFASDTERSAKVTESDCPTHDCQYSEVKNGGAVICVPHRLKIAPTGGGRTPPVTG